MGAGHRCTLHFSVLVAREGAYYVCVLIFVPAWSRYVCPVPVIRIVGAYVVGGQGRNRNRAFVFARLAFRQVVVPGSENDYASCKRAGLHSVLIVTGVFDKVVYRILVGLRYVGQACLIAPAVLAYDGTMVGGPFYGRSGIP